MKLERHVLLAIDDFDNNKLDSALMHACTAIEATAKKLFKTNGRKAYKQCLRQYYWILEPMIGVGINLEETKWSNIEINDGPGKIITDPDIADIIYHIFRCNNAHGEEIPISYSLLPSSDGHFNWKLSKDQVQMPDKVIWALLAISIFSKANQGIVTDGDYYLTWGSETLGIGIYKFIIKDSWGREDAFRTFITPRNNIRVKLEKLERMRENAIES